MDKFYKILEQEKPVLIDFYADWCAPCKIMNPILKEVKDELRERVLILKRNVDKNQKVATRCEVKGIPTLLLF